MNRKEVEQDIEDRLVYLTDDITIRSYITGQIAILCELRIQEAIKEFSADINKLET